MLHRITGADFETLQNGVTLEDGFVKPDEVAHIDEKFGILGIEIHSGCRRKHEDCFLDEQTSSFGAEVSLLRTQAP